MTQEEKELLLRDLSARLIYGVIVDYKESEYDFHNWKIDSLHTPTYSESGILIDTDYEGWINFTEYKGCGMSTGSRPLHLGKNLPFLRSMSSMTDEECVELSKIRPFDDEVEAWKYIKTPVPLKIANIKHFDFFHSHYLDWRGLIEKGLALEAPKDMYNIK